MQVADDQDALVLPPGVSVEPRPKMIPPNNKYFGWIDRAGDENTFLYEEILGGQRSTGDGRYYIYVKGLGQPVPIPREDYYRLLKKMGWQEGERIARA